jgi:hypothetical protein
MMNMQTDTLEIEFDRQVVNLIEKGYPELAGMTGEAFLKLVEPLRENLKDIKKSNDMFPFVIVVKSELVLPEKAMPLVSAKQKKGKVDMTPVDSTYFKQIKTVEIPPSSVYLLVDIDTGKSTLNVTPDDALKVINQDERTPLTIDEGVALMIQFPDVIITQNAFSMLASRSADKKVPAMWISYGNPRLGWCWAGNPHTWLGSASAKERTA